MFLKYYCLKINISSKKPAQEETGKGSHRTFIKPENEDEPGPFTTVKLHGDGTELGYRTIENLLEIFGINEFDFCSS